MSRPLMLDAFSGAGGCGAGYHRAGFTVVGVDLKDQPNYPYEFHQGDALETLDDLLAGKSWHGYRLRDFAAIHGSPPCQAYSSIAKQQRVRSPGKYDAKHLDLVDDTRQRFRATGLPYIIENVIGAPLENPIMLCGSSFGLNVRRHRLFECHGFAVMAPPCAHHWQTPRFRSLDKRRGDKSVVPVHGGGQVAGFTAGLTSVVGAHGHHNYAGERQLREWAMDVHWMSPYELTQAIPPAYCEFVGGYLLAAVDVREAA